MWKVRTYEAENQNGPSVYLQQKKNLARSDDVAFY